MGNTWDTFVDPTLSMTAEVRCDRCGAQAYVRVMIVTGLLDFCAHHYREAEAKITPLILDKIDVRDRLAVGAP